VRQIKEAVQARMAKTEEGGQIDRGIELVDVGIAKIDFVDKVRDAAFQRLIAFMDSVAQENEAEGERAKTEILNEANAKVEQIEGEGKGEANRIRGEAEAQIIRMYADAIKQTGDFYDFIRTLEAYKKAVGGNTRLILTTDSELFRMLKTVPPAGPLPPDVGHAEEPSAETETPKTPPETPAPGETSSQ
jgi:membrane protease subunit HflC